jgi:hypothetical protein
MKAKWISVGEAVALVGVVRMTLWRWHQMGDLRSQSSNGRRYYNVEDLVAFKRARMKRAVSASEGVCMSIESRRRFRARYDWDWPSPRNWDRSEDESEAVPFDRRIGGKVVRMLTDRRGERVPLPLPTRIVLPDALANGVSCGADFITRPIAASREKQRGRDL